MEAHRKGQETERAKAGTLWHDEGWVFATVVGKAINPSTDDHVWKRLLKAAGVRDGRLHAARHTAATTLLILGVPERVVMEIMGWSSTAMAMAKRYQQVTYSIRTNVADQVGGLLWGKKDEPPKGSRRRKRPRAA